MLLSENIPESEQEHAKTISERRKEEESAVQHNRDMQNSQHDLKLTKNNAW